MIYTEAEAKGKVCPLTMPKVSKLDGILWKKYQTRSCLGNKCMAWRWGEPIKQRYVITSCESEQELARPDTVGENWKWVGDAWKGDGEPNGWLEPKTEAITRRNGYCGLAGTPGGAA